MSVKWTDPHSHRLLWNINRQAK